MTSPIVRQYEKMIFPPQRIRFSDIPPINLSFRNIQKLATVTLQLLHYRGRHSFRAAAEDVDVQFILLRRFVSGHCSRYRAVFRGVQRVLDLIDTCTYIQIRLQDDLNVEG